MTFRAGFFYGILIAVACGSLLSGCTPSGAGQLDEEKEPHFLAGKNRVSTFDFKGAVECFEKALQVNPRSAAAHFELAWIFDQREVDPAAAIYHYEHYLLLRPGAPNADLVRQRINSCKQALAETVSLGPVTEKLQRQFEQLSQDKKRLTDENTQLKDDLEKWIAYAARLQTLTNQAAPVPLAQAAAPTPASTSRTPVAVMSQTASSPAPAATTNRTHTVKAGETPTLIARRYGLKVDTLIAANPGLNPRRLKVGQVLRIPGS